MKVVSLANINTRGIDFPKQAKPALAPSIVRLGTQAHRHTNSIGSTNHFLEGISMIAQHVDTLGIKY